MKVTTIYETKQNYALLLWNTIRSMNRKGYLLIGMQSKAYNSKMPRYEKVVY